MGISKDAVAYQIDKLIKKEKFGFFNTQFVHLNLGYASNHHWIKFKRKVAIKKLEKIPHINSINSSFGKFDYQILSYAKTKKEFEETKRAIKKLKPSIYFHAEQIDQYKRYTNVIPPIDVEVKVPTNAKKFEYAFKKENYEKPLSNQKTKIDSVDKKIINSLIKNPRATFQEIHEKTKLNHETIRYRIKKYVKERLINNFGLINNFKKYGLHTNYFLIKAKKINEEKFTNYLDKQKNVFYCAKLKGDYQIIVYVLSKDPTELGKIYDEILGILEGTVEDIDLLFFNEIHKYIQFPERELI